MTPAIDNPHRSERFVVMQRTQGRQVRHGGWRLAENAFKDAEELARAWCAKGDLVVVVDLDLVHEGDDGVVWRTLV